MLAKIRFGKEHLPLPRSRIIRLIIGFTLILTGVLGFLPVLGFWMIPLGLLILSVDLPVVRRWRRKFMVWRGRCKARKIKGDGEDGAA